MSHPPQLPYGGGGDARTGDAPLPARFRRHADMLVRSGRSPLYIELMRSAAEDIEHGGEIARLFEGEPALDGTVQMQLTVHDPAGAPAHRLAVCDDHGLPIRWDTYSPAA